MGITSVCAVSFCVCELVEGGVLTLTGKGSFSGSEAVMIDSGRRKGRGASKGTILYSVVGGGVMGCIGSGPVVDGRVKVVLDAAELGLFI